MRETEKAPTGAATSARAAENGTACETAHASTTEFTTPPAKRQPFRVSDLLLHGAENGVFRRELMALIGYRDRAPRLLTATADAIERGR